MTSPDTFEGTIGRTFRDSQPWWPPQPPAADGKSPNVVFILFDDTGFAHFGCYGSTIETPNIDALAAGGLRYTNFHTTALCSPTRASLLTGRNHHAVGMKAIANHDNGFPNMRGAITKNAATLAEILRDRGYGTFAAGKWHLVPKEETSAAGPFEDWPLQRGFDRFYGFLGGQTDQFYPDLTHDNHSVDPPSGPEDGYHVSEDLVDHSIDFIPRLQVDISQTSVLPLSAVWGDALPAPGSGRVRGEVPREIRRRLGRDATAVVRAATRERSHSGGHRACTTKPGRGAVG